MEHNINAHSFSKNDIFSIKTNIQFLKPYAKNETTYITQKALLMLLKLQNRPYEQCFIKLNTRNSRAKSSHCRGSCQASLSTQKDIKDNRASRQGRVAAS